MHLLVISISLLRHIMSLMIFLRCLQDNLSNLEVDKLLHFSIALTNSFFKNEFYFIIFLQGISLSNWESVWQSQAKLHDRWRVCYKLLILMQGLPLN